MAERKSFLLRIDPETHRALELWARDEFRSVNAQLEFIIKRALREAGRANRADDATAGPG